jgi:predicted AlkP superfamily pyrophosphatase or phosphodiesterase
MNRRVIRPVMAVMVALMATASVAHAQVPPAPKLVVMLVVDQMRGDYVERYNHQWTKGLHRLVSEGAWFRRAAYPYAYTVTCVGHATISTGAYPATHGIVGNAWFDRAQWKSQACSDEAGVATLSYGSPVPGGNGPNWLLTPTLTDEMRAQLPVPVRVVTMSMKARTAIMLAGQKADSATWFSPAAKGLVTSTHYAKELVPFVAAFAKANPVEREFAAPWTRALPADRYLFTDDAIGEKPPAFWTRTFPHAFDEQAKGPLSYEAWDESPLSDAYLGRLAMAAIDGLKLGQGAGTDYLGVSFSALDLVGHDFGPESHEVQDVLIRLDQTLGDLLTTLDSRVGPGNYVLAITADHGVAQIPEGAAADGMVAGRITTKAVAKAVQDGLQRALGTGEYKFRQMGNDLIFEPQVAEALLASPQASEMLAQSIRAVPGISKVFPVNALPALAAAGDREARAALLSFRQGRSGDIVVIPRPYWFYVLDDGTAEPGDGTSHGTPYGYDQHVPIILFGAGIKPGQYLRAVSPVDIAPTLAFLTNVTLARTDGEVLIDALTTTPGVISR